MFKVNDVENFKFLQNQLANWIKGNKYSKDAIEELISMNIPEWQYTGTVFRGMHFDYVADRHDIKNVSLASWTTNYNVAEMFITKGRYGLFLVKTVTNAFSITKFIQYLNENNLMFSEALSRCSLPSKEQEIISEIDVHSIGVFEAV